LSCVKIVVVDTTKTLYRYYSTGDLKKYCNHCDNSYVPQETKTIICQDCGKELIIDSKDNKTIRCEQCQKLKDTELARLRKRKQRNKIN